MKKIKTSCTGKIALLIVGLTAQGIATNAQISASALKDRVHTLKMMLTNRTI